MSNVAKTKVGVRWDTRAYVTMWKIRDMSKTYFTVESWNVSRIRPMRPRLQTYDQHPSIILLLSFFPINESWPLSEHVLRLTKAMSISLLDGSISTTQLNLGNETYTWLIKVTAPLVQ
jgi:hypothetical protein